MGVLRRLLLYLMPLGLYLLSIGGAAIYSGEFTPLRQVIALQAGSTPVLYGRAYRDNYFAYKLLATRLRRPEVLVLGSSRTQQFRSMFFNKNSQAFYNAGQAVQSIYEARQFLEELDKSDLPKILIVGLDQPWFNLSSKYSMPPLTPKVINEEDAIEPTRLLAVSRNIVDDLLSQKIRPDRLLARQDPVHGVQALGLNASVNGMGFRNDGSYQYGTDIVNPPANQARLAEGFYDLEQNVDSHFVAGSEVAPSSVDELQRILEYSKRQGIYVIGFAPPYAPSVYAWMMSHGHHTYIPKMVASLKELFRQYGFSYFDYSDAAQLGATDTDMIDAFHASEFIYLRMYLQMLTRLPDVLGQYSDVDFLRAWIVYPPANRFELFGNQF